MRKGSGVPKFHIVNNRVKVSIGKTFNIDNFEFVRIDYGIEGDVPETCSVASEIDEIQKWLVSAMQDKGYQAAKELKSQE